MVIDSSAIVAILASEPERDEFLERIKRGGAPLVSAANALESSIVLESKLGATASQELDRFFSLLQFQIVPVDTTQFEVARTGWRKFGKGRHPAGLNFGDCFAYALAKVTGEPLLAKGQDFRKTDAVCI